MGAGKKIGQAIGGFLQGAGQIMTTAGGKKKKKVFENDTEATKSASEILDEVSKAKRKLL